MEYRVLGGTGCSWTWRDRTSIGATPENGVTPTNSS